MALDRAPHHPHQGWPSGQGYFTREELSVGLQCHAGVTLATTLLNPCPPHHASLNTSIHYVPIYSTLPFPPPLLYLMAQCTPRLFVLYFTAVNVTWVTLSLLSTDGPLFATLLKKTPTHISCFLILTTCQKTPFSSLFTQPYDNAQFFPWMPECLSLHHSFVFYFPVHNFI